MVVVVVFNSLSVGLPVLPTLSSTPVLVCSSPVLTVHPAPVLEGHLKIRRTGLCISGRFVDEDLGETESILGLIVGLIPVVHAMAQ